MVIKKQITPGRRRRTIFMNPTRAVILTVLILLLLSLLWYNLTLSASFMANTTALVSVLFFLIINIIIFIVIIIIAIASYPKRIYLFQDGGLMLVSTLIILGFAGLLINSNSGSLFINDTNTIVTNISIVHESGRVAVRIDKLEPGGSERVHLSGCSDTLHVCDHYYINYLSNGQLKQEVVGFIWCSFGSGAWDNNKGEHIHRITGKDIDLDQWLQTLP